MSEPETIKLNEIEYVRKDSVKAPNGKRAVVVVDRGWIWAGDVTEEDGRIFLDRAVHVFQWESIGFTGVIENPKSSKVTLKPFANRVEIPSGSVIFRVPVSDKWGL
jgi:hypothetical protein